MQRRFFGLGLQRFRLDGFILYIIIVCEREYIYIYSYRSVIKESVVCAVWFGLMSVNEGTACSL